MNKDIKDIIQELDLSGDYEIDLLTQTWQGSQSFCILFGFDFGKTYSMEEFRELVHPDDSKSALEAFNKCLLTGDDYIYRYRVKNKKTSREFWIEAKGKVYFDAKGTPIKVIGVKRDISDSIKRIETAEKEIKRKTLEEAVATINHHINNNLTVASSAIALLKKKFSGLLDLSKIEEPLHGIAQLVTNLQEVIEGKKDIFSTIESDHISLLNVEYDNTIEILNSAVGEHFIVSVTDTDGKITGVNRLFEEISGYSEEELIGKNHRLLNSGYHGKVFFKKMWEDIMEGKRWHGLITNRRKDGTLYEVDTFIFPSKDLKGNVTKFVSLRYVTKEFA